MAEPAGLEVRRLDEADWAAYRELRLEMLRESPSAFGSRLADALSFDEPHWRQRIRDNAVFVCHDDGRPVGSATYTEMRSSRTDAAAEEAELVAMWVAPGSRGAGAGQLLVEAVLAQARQRGRRRVLLSVVEHNQPARRLYRRCGFVETGVTEPHPNDTDVLELRMEHVLARPPSAAVPLSADHLGE